MKINTNFTFVENFEASESQMSEELEVSLHEQLQMCDPWKLKWKVKGNLEGLLGSELEFPLDRVLILSMRRRV